MPEQAIGDGLGVHSIILGVALLQTLADTGSVRGEWF